ncbi:MAG: DUF324 domain-containing protein [uncultured Sulfurovum sp.]|uniref:DUF324 domain-containing protein n=1 Tax=uncultured Sulfurovum sp. TaxID=269237 RepID=A0A6S6TFW0_9BACT|nr:MAG: DUF324 domain-containing protein [uncultured Sulfurovum sp.]
MYKHRFVAQIVLEATTPLKTASGKSDFIVDAPVLKDWNGLPMILGTSIAGVLRHNFKKEESKVKDIFGDKDGSRLLVSNAHLLDEKQLLQHGLGIENKSDFLTKYENLPIREHTAITHKGVAKEHSKFDEEVVFTGSRFKFELELIGSEDDETIWQEILSLLNSPLFRLGGGSSKGFGEMRVDSCLEQTYILGKDYDSKPSDLNVSKGEDKDKRESTVSCSTYKISIKPDSFFSFGAGFGDDKVDDISVTEEIVKWDKVEGYFSEKQILMSASSLKGALSHRVAFHYNKLEKKFIENIKNVDDHMGENNLAVATIFGASKSHKHEGKGKALFSDMYHDFNEDEVKIFDHVKIDRFTGAAMDSALYNEKVNAQKDIWNIEIVLADDIVDSNIEKAFKDTLDDLCKGLLPLGGKVNRGHGIFEGSWSMEENNNVEK